MMIFSLATKSKDKAYFHHTHDVGRRHQEVIPGDAAAELWEMHLKGEYPRDLLERRELRV